MVQQLRIRLQVPGTWVPFLVQEDPTGHAAIKPLHYDYRACVKPRRCYSSAPSHNYRNKRSHRNEKPTLRKSRAALITATREKPVNSNKDPVQPKIDSYKKNC